MSIQTATVQVFTATDGKQFHDIDEAKAYQFALENGEKIDFQVEQFLNSTKRVGRARSLASSVAKEVAGFLLSWDGETTYERPAEPAPKVVEEVKEEVAEEVVAETVVEEVEEDDFL